jgi:hypothetical protein
MKSSQISRPDRLKIVSSGGGTLFVATMLFITGAIAFSAQAAFNHPTYSSPIVLSADNKLLW